MNIEQARSILKLEGAQDAAMVALRWRQISAFFATDLEDSEAVVEIASKTNALFEEAYTALPKVVDDAVVSSAQQILPPSKGSEKTSGIKHLIFPEGGSSPGEPLSDSWWKVYKRSVLLGLIVLGLVFYAIPRIQWTSNTRPAKHYSPLDLPVEPVVVSGDRNEPGGQGTAGGVIDSPIDLNPLPNKSPLVIRPTQSPTNFVVGLFSALSSGGSYQSMIKQPPDFSVSGLLTTSDVQCPDPAAMPSDALQVVSQDDSAAIVRVQESYFTGKQAMSDYYLVSDNGVWKLSEIKAVNGSLP